MADMRHTVRYSLYVEMKLKKPIYPCPNRIRLDFLARRLLLPRSPPRDREGLLELLVRRSSALRQAELVSSMAQAGHGGEGNLS